MIEIKQRRLVPNKAGYGHKGKHASLAESDWFRAWGFGDTQSQADENAKRKVSRARAS